jgi:phosphate/sulfate permease
MFKFLFKKEQPVETLLWAWLLTPLLSCLMARVIFFVTHLEYIPT